MHSANPTNRYCRGWILRAAKISKKKRVRAAVLSLLVSATITVPLRRLRAQAGLILDKSGRLRGRLPPTRRRDEIGDLSRRFGELTLSIERQIRLAESFASDISHEFKNPLASIRSASELLSREQDEHRREDLVSFVLEDVSRMERMLSAVRELSRLDSETHGVEARPVDPKAIAEGMIEGMRRRRVAHSVKLLVSGDCEQVAVPPERLLEVLENLVDNAVGFSPEGGCVRIDIENDGDEVCIRVSDQGLGIPDEHISKIFERFFTFRPQGNPGRLHSGLGLAIVKAIVDGCGGTVEASNGKSGGAVFEVRLPRA
jgi:two-component system sensor histidine kinase ChvG